MKLNRPLNATSASLLGFLHEGPMSGWDLWAAAHARIGDFWSLTRSQVYRELAAMADAGLIVPGPAGPRDRLPFAITGTGRAAFAEWVEGEPGPETIRFPLLLTIVFGRHLPPERLAAFVQSHKAAHADRLRAYQHVQKEGRLGDDPYAAATLDFGLAYERAVLAWFDSLPPAICAPNGSAADDDSND